MVLTKYEKEEEGEGRLLRSGRRGGVGVVKIKPSAWREGSNE